MIRGYGLFSTRLKSQCIGGSGVLSTRRKIQLLDDAVPHGHVMLFFFFFYVRFLTRLINTGLRINGVATLVDYL